MRGRKFFEGGRGGIPVKCLAQAGQFFEQLVNSIAKSARNLAALVTLIRVRIAQANDIFLRLRV